MSEIQITSTEFQDEPREQPKPVSESATNASSLSSKLNSNFYQRTRTTIYMIVGFALVLSSGQFYSCGAVVFISTFIFSEINNIKRNQEKQVQIPMTKYINWYIFFAYNYFLLGKFLMAKLPYLGMKYQFIGQILVYHNFITFSLFIVGFLSFVLSLKQGFLKYQFRLFGWIIIASLLIATPAWSIIGNVYEGLIWFVLPSMLIVCNDIFAYVFGYFFGKHQLIALSPKKTWEGYIGGAITTCFFSIILTSALQTIDGITCPSSQLNFIPFYFPTCQTSLVETFQLGPIGLTTLQVHFMLFSLFASIIGPFGGFFASGLKRSIKIKDFANSIPGHGGVSDRMDCQLIMGAFVSIYHQTFVKISIFGSAAYILSMLTPQEQLNLYKHLKISLKNINLL